LFFHCQGIVKSDCELLARRKKRLMKETKVIVVLSRFTVCITKAVMYTCLSDGGEGTSTQIQLVMVNKYEDVDAIVKQDGIKRRYISSF
jgi:hypothetical protein